MPPNWFEENGYPGLCLPNKTDWSNGQMWYTNYTMIPGEATVGINDPRRTYQETSSRGWAPPHNKHPWRAPGSAKAVPCGVLGGNKAGCVHADGTPSPCDVGGTGHGPDARDYYNQGKFPNVVTTEWKVGSVQETGWIFTSNHGGGYSYRLCPASKNLTEECFQQHPLDFVGDSHFIQWGPDKSTRMSIPAMYTKDGTYPKGSQWARIPIPSCVDTNNWGGGYYQNPPGISQIYCEEYPWVAKNPTKVGTQFPPPAPGLYGWGNSYLDQYVPGLTGQYLPFFIGDKVQIPSNLPAGDYVLSHRWDCEQSAQVWTSCANIKLVDHDVEQPAMDRHCPIGEKPDHRMPIV
jgi:hypothetical protein